MWCTVLKNSNITIKAGIVNITKVSWISESETVLKYVDLDSRVNISHAARQAQRLHNLFKKPDILFS